MLAVLKMDRIHLVAMLLFGLGSVAVLGSCVSGATAGSGVPYLPQSTFGTYKTVSRAVLPQSTFSAKDCTCTPCICEPGSCVCAACGLGCGKKRAAAQQDSSTAMQSIMMETPYAVGQTIAYEQPVSYVSIPQSTFTPQGTTAQSTDPTICPCCGMKMTEEQMKTMKAKQTASAPAPTQSAPAIMWQQVCDPTGRTPCKWVQVIVPQSPTGVSQNVVPSYGTVFPTVQGGYTTGSPQHAAVYTTCSSAGYRTTDGGYAISAGDESSQGRGTGPIRRIISRLRGKGAGRGYGS